MWSSTRSRSDPPNKSFNERRAIFKSSLFLFASELHDEGYDHVLDNVQQRGGIDGVSIAASYHHSRDLFPHNPKGKIRFLRGEVFFQPDEALFTATKIRPVLSPYLASYDPLATLTDKAAQRGIVVRAWTNNMHNTLLASQHPDCAIENAFGDTIITNLCPANPDVRAYVCALSANIARYPVQALLTESVIYMPYDHGYHHERTLLPLTGTHRFLMSLCFCPHCMSAGKNGGVDMERVRQFVKTEMQRVFDGQTGALDDVPPAEAQVGELLDGMFARLIQVRQETVTSLMAEIVAAVKHERVIPITFIDLSGGVRGAGAGMSVVDSTATAPQRAWQDGVDFQRLAAVCDSFSLLGYTHDTQQLRSDLNEYRQRLPPDYPLSVVMRPMPPDAHSANDTLKIARTIVEANPEWLEFYHYGMMRLESLDWIKQTLAVLR